jgi:YVTN family beta-propeller protein
MSKKIILIAFLTFQLLFISCSKDPDPVITGIEDSYLSGSGVFILNEGNFRAGNGSLSFFSYDSSKVYNHVFLNVNEKSLGDIPYSMGIMNNKAYILVNNSGKIEVINSKTAESVTTINKINSPRYISFVSDTKAYITSLYSDSLTIINPFTDVVSGYINMKHPSESIVTSNSKAYVAHWTSGSKIFIINTMDNRVVDSIAVGNEPESMVIDKNGILWVLCNGGWQREYFAEMFGINTETDIIEKHFVFPFKTDSPTCLTIDSNGENLYYLHEGVRKMGIGDSKLPEVPFISGSAGNFYKIGVNPGNNEIFVTDVVDYQQKGFVLRYNKNGSLIARMEADIIPGSVCFREKSSLPSR